MKLRLLRQYQEDRQATESLTMKEILKQFNSIMNENAKGIKFPGCGSKLSIFTSNFNQQPASEVIGNLKTSIMTRHRDLVKAHVSKMLRDMSLSVLLASTANHPALVTLPPLDSLENITMRQLLTIAQLGELSSILTTYILGKKGRLTAAVDDDNDGEEEEEEEEEEEINTVDSFPTFKERMTRFFTKYQPLLSVTARQSLFRLMFLTVQELKDKFLPPLVSHILNVDHNGYRQLVKKTLAQNIGKWISLIIELNVPDFSQDYFPGPQVSVRYMTVSNKVLAALVKDFISLQNEFDSILLLFLLGNKCHSINWKCMQEMWQHPQELWATVFPGIGQKISQKGYENLDFQCSAKTDGYSWNFLCVHKARPTKNNPSNVNKVSFGNIMHVSLGSFVHFIKHSTLIYF